MLIAVLAEEQGDTKARDDAIQNYPANLPLGSLRRILRDHFQGKAKDLDLKAVEAALEKVEDPIRADAWYAIGRLLAHEKRPEASDYFKRSSEAKQIPYYTTAASNEARRGNEK